MNGSNRWRDAALVLGGAFVGASGLGWSLAVVVAAALGASFVWFGAKRPGQADPGQAGPENVSTGRAARRAGMN